MKNTKEQIIDVTPERVDIVSHVSPKEKVMMLAVTCALIAAAYAASYIPNASYSNTTVIKPVTKQISYRKLDDKSLNVGDVIPVKGYLKSSVDSSLSELQNSMELTSKTLEKQKALHNVEAAFYKSHFKNEPLSPQESRKLLLKAGFKPPEPKPVTTTRRHKNSDSQDGLAFSHGIAKELIRDEVEGFFLKVKLATQVGEYLLSD